MTTLTHEEQALVRPVLRAGKTATRASLAGVVRIDFHSHALCQQGLVGEIAMQLGEGPLGSMVVCPPLLLAGCLAMRALGALTEVCQVFQSDDAVWVRVHNAMTDLVVAILLQPSLSSTHDDQSSCRGTSAFFLQPVSQSRIVIGFGTCSLAGIELTVVLGIGTHSQVPLSDVNANHVGMIVWSGLCYLQFKREKQVELLVRLIIPELRSPEMGALLHERHVFGVARVGNNHTPVQGEQTHLRICLQAVVPMVVVGNRRGDVLGGSIQPLVAFLGLARLAQRSIVLHLCPQGLIGGSHLARDVTSHLGWQMILRAYLVVAVPLQSTSTTQLAMLIRISTDKVQGIAIRQLRGAQCLELRVRGM